MWVVPGFSNNVTKLQAITGQSLETFPVPGGPRQLAFDGANIWVTHAGNVTKPRAIDGQNLGTFPVGNSPRSVAFDGANIWVVNTASGTLTKILVWP